MGVGLYAVRGDRSAVRLHAHDVGVRWLESWTNWQHGTDPALFDLEVSYWSWFSPGETTKLFRVPIRDDRRSEPTESLTVRASTETGWHSDPGHRPRPPQRLTPLPPRRHSRRPETSLTRDRDGARAGRPARRTSRPLLTDYSALRECRLGLARVPARPCASAVSPGGQKAASASLSVFEGRITCVRLVVVGAVVATDVGRAALDREQLLVDRLLLLGQPLGQRGERRGQLGVLGLPGQLLGPVQRQVEVAAAVVDAADPPARGLALVEQRAGGPVEGVGEDLRLGRCRSCPARCSKLTASARNSPRLSQRR